MKTTTVLRKATKAMVLPSGLLAARAPGDVVVLLYHRVGAGSREIDLSVEAFRHQLELLAERDRVVALDDALGSGSRGGVVISIDDGFRDFHDHVLPLLVRYDLPAVLYLATAFVATAPSRSRDRDALTWAHLRDAVATGLVTVGAHTHTHRDLSRADEGTADEEMRRSKERIEDELQLPCRHFAYPWSVASPAADRVARRLFASAASTWRTNRRGRIEPHRLGRTPVLRSDGRVFFDAKVRGAMDGEAALYRMLGRGPWARMR
jgi:peptidoglycan/xylan/chitin deacetylase (PgdA/CDA1 family)